MIWYCVAISGKPREHLLDLGREHVHAAQDEHVVGTADDAIDLAMRAAAGARLGDDAGDVAGAVAHKRAALARERGEHQLAVFAIGHRLQGVGVDDLGEEVVLGQVQAAHLLALEGHARAHDLGQAVHVAVLHAKLLGDLVAHALAAGLGAEDAGANLQIGCRVDTHLDGGIGDMQGVGRRAREHVDLHVLEHLDLTLRCCPRRWE